MIRLMLTCTSCPEQYDAFYEDAEVGYLRLRHGIFTVTYLPTQEIIYSAQTIGDGAFDASEREHHLNTAKTMLLSTHLSKTLS